MEAQDMGNPAPRGSATTGFTMRMPCLEAGSNHENNISAVLVDSSPLEEFDARQLPSPDEIDDLLRQGVPPSALWRPTSLRAANIVWVAPGRFEFQECVLWDVPGERTLLFLVEDSGGWALDIIAWAPQTNRIGSWLGYAWGLGEGGIYKPRLEPDALPVHRSPLSWLRAKRKGIVLLEPQLAASFLRDAAPLLAEDVEHGLELEKQLTMAAPRIVVPDPSARRT